MKFSTFFVFSTALLALCLMLVFRCRRQKIRIQALEQRLQQEHRLAHTDPLTGLSNRAAYEERLDLLTDRHSGADICCVVLDADRFKSVNDENGHRAGDIALQNIACTLQKIFNEDDDHELFRIGGDEFALILHGLSPAETTARLSLVNMLLHRRSIELGIELSVSAGRAFLGEQGVHTVRDAFGLADRRMYLCKKSASKV